MGEVGPRTSKRAAVYTARNIDHPAPAVPVIYDLTKEEKKTREIEENERMKRIQEIMPISSSIWATSSILKAGGHA